MGVSRSNILTNLSMFALAAYPVLNAYMIFGTLTLAELTGLLLFLSCIVLQPDKKLFRCYPKLFLLFWLYAAMHIIVFSGESFKLSYLIPGGINFCLYAISLCVLCYNFNFQYFRKYIWMIFVFATALFLVQMIVQMQTGMRICVFLPLTKQLAYSATTYAELVNIQAGYEDRFASIFLEPSYFGQYSLIVFTVELFCKENKEKFFTNKAVFVAIIILLIKSGIGLLGMLVVSSAKIIQVVLMSHKRKYYLYLLVLIPIAISSVNIYLNSDIGSGVSERASFSRNEDGEFDDGSTNERLLNGFLEYKGLDTSEKIFGTSVGNRIALSDKDSAINGFSDSMITYGLIGTLLLLLMYIEACWHKPFLSKAFAIILLLVSFLETILFDDFMLVCSVIILCYKEQGCDVGRIKQVASNQKKLLFDR